MPIAPLPVFCWLASQRGFLVLAVRMFQVCVGCAVPWSMTSWRRSTACRPGQRCCARPVPMLPVRREEREALEAKGQDINHMNSVAPSLVLDSSLSLRRCSQEQRQSGMSTAAIAEREARARRSSFGPHRPHRPRHSSSKIPAPKINKRHSKFLHKRCNNIHQRVPTHTPPQKNTRHLRTPDMHRPSFPSAPPGQARSTLRFAAAGRLH